MLVWIDGEDEVVAVWMDASDDGGTLRSVDAKTRGTESARPSGPTRVLERWLQTSGHQGQALFTGAIELELKTAMHLRSGKTAGGRRARP